MNAHVSTPFGLGVVVRARRSFVIVPPSTPERQAANAGIECIGCGVCHASCDVVGWNPAYLGPAALNRAWTLDRKSVV